MFLIQIPHCMSQSLALQLLWPKEVLKWKKKKTSSPFRTVKSVFFLLQDRFTKNLCPNMTKTVRSSQAVLLAFQRNGNLSTSERKTTLKVNCLQSMGCVQPSCGFKCQTEKTRARVCIQRWPVWWATTMVFPERIHCSSWKMTNPYPCKCFFLFTKHHLPRDELLLRYETESKKSNKIWD